MGAESLSESRTEPKHFTVAESGSESESEPESGSESEPGAESGACVPRVGFYVGRVRGGA